MFSWRNMKPYKSDYHTSKIINLRGEEGWVCVWWVCVYVGRGGGEECRIRLIDFAAIFCKGDILVTSCLLSYTQSPFWEEVCPERKQWEPSLSCYIRPLFQRRGKTVGHIPPLKGNRYISMGSNWHWNICFFSLWGYFYKGK